MLDKLLVLLQRWIPARLIGRFIYHLARIETVWLKNILIRGFTRLYGVDTSEAAKPVPDGYRCFNDFFTRDLKPDARPIARGSGNLTCPADGTVAQTGQANKGELIQAKGIHFNAADLLGDEQLAEELADCHYATIYLAPHNYHRLHMPLAGNLEQSIFIPGQLYSVNARTTANLPGLYALNERLVCNFYNPAGRFAMVLVGAINVASISTAWAGEITPPADGRPLSRRFPTNDAPYFDQGEYMGHFNMGSTVVLLGPATMTGWHADMQPGATVRVGQLAGALDKHL